MNDKATEKLVGRTWQRSARQGAGTGARTYTSGGGPIAPSRGGTETLLLNPDGRFVMRVAGPDDRPRDLTGSWRAAGDGVELQTDDGSVRATARVADDDKLVVTDR